ncbi:mediator of RNA polymerase II transcription subunit 17 isoform X2 [Aristolochia californica]|uniref:mediator of RNA polymerase II transcription subunit 17 isoform X2 n=1 Tax=Aristolochia californica TaxID=171875 RepID=UPI0035D953FB
MDESMKISVDKLPIKRLDVIEENGMERFPPDIGEDDKRLAQIRRIDFTPLVEKDSKKVKTSNDTAATAPWPWQSMVENLQLAHQELSVIMDLINTVEANDAVTVAGMTRPKQLPGEMLSDLAVSAATKLQCFRHLGRYFKQSAKALEKQVAREARFYGALIRLQQNWKIKRQRPIAASSSEGFTIDLSDNSLLDSTVVFHPLSISTVRIDRDAAGMLAINLPPKSCRSIQFNFSSDSSSSKLKKLCNSSDENLLQEGKKESLKDEDVDRCVKETHSVLREVHRAIFDEQVFDLVNREAVFPSLGVSVTGIREDCLQLGIGQEASVFLSLTAYEKDKSQMIDRKDCAPNDEFGVLPIDKVDDGVIAAEKQDKFTGFPNPISCEIYLRQIFHENVFVGLKERRTTLGRTQTSGQSTGPGCGLLGHFCMTLAHKIFSRKVLVELENLVHGVPYLHLLSHPTWNSRSSSWTLSVKLPQSIIHAGRRTRPADAHEVRSQFYTKVVVTDECISVSGEGAPNVVGLFKSGGSVDVCSMNSYNCNLENLSLILLQQVASQVIRWLHEEALIIGMKTSIDFLGLTFELDQCDTLSLVAHVDPDDARGCISWWLVMEDGSMEESKFGSDFPHGPSENRRFLGSLSLEALYSMLTDLPKDH